MVYPSKRNCERDRLKHERAVMYEMIVANYDYMDQEMNRKKRKA